jgi:hypothetical protein
VAESRVFGGRVPLKEQKIHRHIFGGSAGAGGQKIKLHCAAEWRIDYA